MGTVVLAGEGAYVGAVHWVIEDFCIFSVAIIFVIYIYIYVYVCMCGFYFIVWQVSHLSLTSRGG